MRIILTTFLSLDGVYQGPGSPDEDRSGGFDRGGWLVPFVDPVFEERATAWTSTATCFLFGRRTYDAFSSFWPTVVDPADKVAAQLNNRPKYVATTKPVNVSWNPLTVIDSNMPERVSALKEENEGELQIHGSGQLGRSLVEEGLIDELRLVIAPVVVGLGRRLFDGVPKPLGFTPLSHEQTPSGLSLFTYACSGAANTATYKRGAHNEELTQ